MGKYTNLGAMFDRKFRNSLNGNFDNIDVDIQAQKTRVDNLIVGTPQPSEVVDARGGSPVLKDRLDGVDSSLADMAINLRNFPIQVPETDDTARINRALSSMVEGQTLSFPKGSYNISSPIYVDKAIRLSGNNAAWNGVQLIFNRCGGFILQSPSIVLNDLVLIETNRQDKSVLDIKNRVYGDVGIKFEYSDNKTSSSTILKNVSITGFNVGMVMFPQGTQTWSGAYREFYNLHISNNDVGIAGGGATFEKFYGGYINTNSLHGVYFDNNAAENDTTLEFVGTSIEGNGTNDYTNMVFTDGIYAGLNTNIYLKGCYLESETIFADVCGKITLDDSYVNKDVLLFGSGSIVNKESIGSYAITKKYDSTNMISFAQGVTTSMLSSDLPYVKITSSTNGLNYINLGTFSFNPISVKDFRGAKLSFQYKVLNGTGSATYGIRPDFIVHGKTSQDATGGMNRTFTPNLNASKTIGELKNMEIYYQSRKDNLNLNDVIESLTVSLMFTKSDYSSENSDYSLQNLDIEILNPVITLFTTVDASAIEPTSQPKFNNIENTTLASGQSIDILLSQYTYTLIQATYSGPSFTGIAYKGVFIPNSINSSFFETLKLGESNVASTGLLKPTVTTGFNKVTITNNDPNTLNIKAIGIKK